jgi:FkbM family methyltransferase
VRRLAHRVLQSAGYDLVRFPPADSLGAHLAALFAGLRVNCVLDVGAHRGEYGQLLRRLGYRGRIVSFEPVPESFGALEQSCRRDPDWLAWRIALGASQDTRGIRVTKSTQFSSFLTANAEAAGRFGDHVDMLRTEPVAVRRLEEVFAECVDGIAAPRVFLKLDTQGVDLEVLRGAGSRLVDVQGLQCELALKPMYEGAPSYAEAVAVLSGLGFEPTGIFAVSRDHALRLIEIDCVLSRTP